jgi:hypothetical protein
MSVEVDYFFADNIWQNAGPTVGWSWPLGPQDGRFWMVTVIPEYANVGTLLASGLSWSTDNNELLTANIGVTITAAAGALLGFKAIRVPSV